MGFMDDPAEEEQLPSDPDLRLQRRTILKLDWILLPFLSLLFLLNSLDRSNIGNAETANFTKDAGLDPEDLNIAVAWFFIVFVVLQPFGAAAGRKFGMARWVPSVMAIWGICTTLHVFIHKKWQLISLRVLIGMLEAGFYPTTVSYLSLFYTRYEFAQRLGLFYGQYAVAGAVGGILSYLVLSEFPNSDTPDPHAWKSWQVLFVFEGALTMVVASVGFFWLPRSADTAWFLNKKERAWAEKRVRTDLDTADPTPPPRSYSLDAGRRDVQDPDLSSRLLPDTEPEDDLTLRRKPSMTSDSGLSNKDILSTFVSLPIVLYLLTLNILSALPGTAFSVFLPLIISSMNIGSPVHANLLTAPPFLLAAVVLYAFTYWSDKIRNRTLPILVGLAVTGTGLILTLLSIGAGTKYASLCILLSGSFIASPLTVAWFASNVPEPGKRAIVLGINGWGNLAGVLSSLIFAPQFKGDGYRFSLIITTGCVVMAFAGYLAFRAWLRSINAQKEALLTSWDENDKELERRWGIGGGTAFDLSPSFGWWERFVRKWIGEKILSMGDSAWMRRGDERLTFRYGL